MWFYITHTIKLDFKSFPAFSTVNMDGLTMIYPLLLSNKLPIHSPYQSHKQRPLSTLRLHYSHRPFDKRKSTYDSKY
ncbi:hypothetical protein XM75_c10149 [Vibrio vulnificus]|nr:hypothetical protein XM75_c10149 [Vibrio vulnificus]